LFETANSKVDKNDELLNFIGDALSKCRLPIMTATLEGKAILKAFSGESKKKASKIQPRSQGRFMKKGEDKYKPNTDRSKKNGFECIVLYKLMMAVWDRCLSFIQFRFVFDGSVVLLANIGPLCWTKD
jgi:hypothetical protein